MASDLGRDSDAAHKHFWIGKETPKTVSLFSTNGAAKIPHCLIGRNED